ncbi:Dabb family protein [Nocardia transvalensis]|uniref:Dabb family protein n=1 Tax=Nocardia transvalensis TaxID=37333 RepID=UPI001894F346|nr:Dabb family protein [Nocardia transvalensis]MBF6331835.1 Dabb family protein [Nocardia transvalensis]
MTVRHIVLFTLNPGVGRSDARVAAAAALSESHREHIPEILEWWTGFDCGNRSISADFAVMGRFEDMDAVARYLEHPHHREGVSAWSSVASWTVIDLNDREIERAHNV